MIDPMLLREQPHETVNRIKRKDPQFPGERLIELDIESRRLRVALDTLRAERNECAELGKKGVTPELRERSRSISAQLAEIEVQAQRIDAELRDLMLRAPNIPVDTLPNGGKEANQVVKTVGDAPQFSFPIKNHLELGTALGWFDFAAAAAMTGSNFALYKGDGVRLLYSMMQYMLMNNMRHGYEPVLPPYLVTEKSLEGAGNFPRFKEEVYSVPADGLFLTPTAEVNLSNLYRDRIFAADDLPLRMTSWTSCFRREAGGYGAAERGLIRIHQFEKVELYTICEPEKSSDELDRMVACAESILKGLDLHYRISLLAAGDCSFSSAKTYDIEVWMPGQREYKEVSSCSNCTDFQARRTAMRYRTEQSAKPRLVNTLNASSLAAPRLMVALMETYQQADGTIAIPEVLKTIPVWC